MGDSRVFPQPQVLKSEQAAGVKRQQHFRPLHDIQPEGASANYQPLALRSQRQNHAVIILRQHWETTMDRNTYIRHHTAYKLSIMHIRALCNAWWYSRLSAWLPYQHIWYLKSRLQGFQLIYLYTSDVPLQPIQLQQQVHLPSGTVTEAQLKNCWGKHHIGLMNSHQKIFDRMVHIYFNIYLVVVIDEL